METNIFESVITFPDPIAQEKYNSLVGIEYIKQRLQQEASIMLEPSTIEEWSNKFYGHPVLLTELIKKRPPLFIFSGDVGTGKTMLAESFADEIARSKNVQITLYKLSLSARGSGIVGEMTKLISEAFQEIKLSATASKKTNNASILFIDEADALAQTREVNQMHHEDKAGVNALIRGIDSLRDLPSPAIVIMCTNRNSAIDPAIRRRSAVTFEFGRPSAQQCYSLLERYFNELGFSDVQINEIVSLCVPYTGLSYGYTYSDLTHKVLPSVLLSAYPDKQVIFDNILSIIKSTPPTVPFNETDF